MHTTELILLLPPKNVSMFYHFSVIYLLSNMGVGGRQIFFWGGGCTLSVNFLPNFCQSETDFQAASECLITSNECGLDYLKYRKTL